MAKGKSCFCFIFPARFFNDARRGAFASEFALLSVPFFLLMMGMIEMCLMEGAQQILESASFNASRLAKTGYVASEKTQDQTVSQILVNELSSYGLLLDTSRVSMTSTIYDSFSSAAAGGGISGYGLAGQIVAYKVTYPWKVFTPMMCEILGDTCKTGNIINLQSTIVVRNEPYS